jgi:hypothetical protein
MDYLKIYNAIIDRAKLRNKDINEYYEKHHIIPKCLGGKNNKENFVFLTAKEHFVSHWLLFKIYGGSKLAHAWNSMCRVSKGQEARLINSRTFSRARETHRRLLQQNSSGDLNNFYGKKHSDESKRAISTANKGRIKSKEEIENWVEKVSSKSKTDEHKRKISRKNLCMIQNIQTLEIKRVPIETLGKIYDINQWVNPKKITPEQKFSCSYCNMVTTKSNLKRWHNENCKNYECR